MRHLLPLLSILLVACSSGRATTTVVTENDLYNVGGNRDRYYTNGFRASALFPTEEAPQATQDIARELPGYSRKPVEAIGVAVGQNLYTPEDITVRRNQDDERPWAGWTYVGLLFAQIDYDEDDLTSDRLETYELDLGVVGPSALGEESQRKVHQIVGSPTPRGWDNQLHDEPALMFSYERRERWWAGELGDDAGWDGLARWGGTLGNVRTEARAGMEWRTGFHLPRDFGASTIRRASVDVAPGEARDGWSLYTFAGGDVYGVARNIFLDGNTFRSSHSVGKEYLLLEARAGVALQLGPLRLSYAQNTRSPEFRKQSSWQRYGTLQLEFVADF